MNARVEKLVRPALNLTDFEKEKYVHDFICENVRYDKLKKAYSHEKAMQMILTGECGVFQPLLLDCFCDIQEEVRKVTQEKSEKEGKISGFELTDLKETLKNSHLIGDLKPEKNH